MTPKRFKAVCTKTGAEETDISIVFPKESHKNLITYEGPYKIFSSKGILVEGMGWEPYQSTGMTDAKGQEVYEGDVLYDVDGSEIEDEDIIGNMRIIEFDGIGFDFFCYFDSSRDDGYKDFHRYLSHHVVIGNRWMPAAELQARAEAVSNEQN